MKNPFKEISSRLGIADERLGEPEDITTETIQAKVKRRKRLENMKTDSAICGSRIFLSGLGRGDPQGREGQIIEEIMAENFPNLMKL